MRGLCLSINSYPKIWNKTRWTKLRTYDLGKKERCAPPVCWHTTVKLSRELCNSKVFNLGREKKSAPPRERPPNTYFLTLYPQRRRAKQNKKQKTAKTENTTNLPVTHVSQLSVKAGLKMMIRLWKTKPPRRTERRCRLLELVSPFRFRNSFLCPTPFPRLRKILQREKVRVLGAAPAAAGVVDVVAAAISGP